jgi:hypothetical protein
LCVSQAAQRASNLISFHKSNVEIDHERSTPLNAATYKGDIDFN